MLIKFSVVFVNFVFVAVLLLILATIITIMAPPLTPPVQGTPANIRINLMLPETRDIGLHHRR